MCQKILNTEKINKTWRKLLNFNLARVSVVNMFLTWK